jgi:hypothetical protein
MTISSNISIQGNEWFVLVGAVACGLSWVTPSLFMLVKKLADWDKSVLVFSGPPKAPWHSAIPSLRKEDNT